MNDNRELVELINANHEAMASQVQTIIWRLDKMEKIISGDEATNVVGMGERMRVLEARLLPDVGDRIIAIETKQATLVKGAWVVIVALVGVIAREVQKVL